MRLELLDAVSIVIVAVAMTGCAKTPGSTKHPPPGSVERREDGASLMHNRFADRGVAGDLRAARMRLS